MTTTWQSGMRITPARLNDRPFGYVAGLVATANVATSAGTELVVDYLNFTAISGRYELRWSSRLQGTVGTDAYRIRFRYLATSGALTTAGISFHSADVNGVTSAIQAVFTKTLTGLTVGTQYAIGVTLQRTSGTGVITAAGGAATERVLDLYHVG